MTPRLLDTRAVEKVWGREELPPPFACSLGKRIGEIWFEPPPELASLLAKYLFTSEKLSVQVHPPGKDECWLVLDCEEGASLATGFAREFTLGELRAGAKDGSIEAMLHWRTIEPGDFVYLPAGTVHAIGGGCTLLEMQQNCGITYRLFDYGRPRKLHLEAALAVADTGPHDPALWAKAGDGPRCLVDGPHFRLDRMVGTPGAALRAAHDSACLVLPLSGTVKLGGLEVEAGQCALAEGLADYEAAEGGIALACSAR